MRQIKSPCSVVHSFHSTSIPVHTLMWVKNSSYVAKNMSQTIGVPIFLSFLAIGGFTSNAGTAVRL